MFGLRIVRFAEDFRDENLAAAGRDNNPNQRAQRESERQETRRVGDVDLARYLLKSNAPFLRA